MSVALTGNVASGKSEVARRWSDRGVPVVRADDLAREAVEPGGAALDEIRETFGDEVLTGEGTLDRDAVRALVFSDDHARRRLEAILHPEIRKLREGWIEERRTEGAEVVVSEIPLLFETGSETSFDAVVFVDAPEDLRIARMVRDRELTEAEARRISESQMPPERKRKCSDHVLVNDGTLEELRRRADEVLDSILHPPLVRMDLHMHTWGSWDCLSDPEDVVERSREAALGRIAITDHDRLEVALDTAARHPERVIAGEEVRTAEGVDFTGLYLSEAIPAGIPAEEVAARIREQGGVVYLPHPYASGKGGGGRHAEELARLADIVETFNARLHPRGRNRPAEELARRHGKLRGAGSDAHTVAEVGNGWVVVPDHENEPSAFLRALRRARVHGVEASRLVHLASTWAKVRKKLPGAPGPLGRRGPES